MNEKGTKHLYGENVFLFRAMKGSSHQKKKKKKKNTNRIQYSPKGCTVSPVSDSFKLILIRNLYAPVT